MTTTKRDQPLTFIQCPAEHIGLVEPDMSPEEQEALRATEVAEAQWIAEAAKHCRCADLWKPCEGVLAGGVCDELEDDSDTDWDEDDWNEHDWGRHDG
jgi:hypothetical protein